ncbi:MAG: hypothetical protein ACOC5T_00540 [Elusimicrobiota bacterium]
MPADFKKGDKVVYIPRYAKNSLIPPDIEYGVVSSVNDTCVHVKYDGDIHTKATHPSDLDKVHSLKGE